MARHDSGDAAYAERALDRLEDLRLRLEDRFEQVPGGVTVVVHTNPAWLSMAHPFLPAARWSAAPAGRRYLAGWAMATELHVLNDHHLDRRAAGPDSREALRGIPDRLYAQLVLAANNPDLPPSWTPRRFGRYLRWAWLVEGGAQYFARQSGLYRAALEEERGSEACELLVSRLHRDGPAANLEAAFEARARDIENVWRDHLREISRPSVD